MGYDGIDYSSVAFGILLVLLFFIIMIEIYGQVFIIRNTTLVYSAADIPIDIKSDSALSTWGILIGRLSTVISAIFQAQKITILNHFQVINRLQEGRKV